MFNKRTFLTGGLVLLEDMSYWKICLMGRHILWDIGGHVLPVDMSYCMAFLKGYVRGHVSWDDVS